MRTAFILTVLLGLLAASVGVAVWAWRELDDAAISWHGVIALWLGAGLTFLLGVGLMALLFLSNRRGYDDRAHYGEALPPRAPRDRDDHG